MDTFRAGRDTTDEQLMVCISRGEETAFDELYRRYSRRLLYYFHRMLGWDEGKAQDFLQDLFLKIVERPALFRPEERFETWVFAVAHNMCKNEYRRLEVRRNADQEMSVDSVSPATDAGTHAALSLDRKTFQKRLLQELEKLDEDQRSAFLLRFQEGFSIREISEAMGCSEGTTKSRIFYTTRKLAERLKIFDPRRGEEPCHERE
jgi:RNA polymerase sigma-70 factor (ECF subfamily)